MTVFSIFIFLTNFFLYTTAFAITPTEMPRETIKNQLLHKNGKKIQKKTKKEMLYSDKQLIKNIVISLSAAAFFFICVQYNKSILNYLHAYIKSIFSQEYATLEQNIQNLKNSYENREKTLLEQQKSSDEALQNFKKKYEKEEQEKSQEINKLKQQGNALTNGMIQVTQNISEHRNAITSIDNSMKSINPYHVSTLHKKPLLELFTNFITSFFTGKNITIMGTFSLLVGAGCYFWEKISKRWFIKYPLKSLKAIKQLVWSKNLSQDEIERIVAGYLNAEIERTNGRLVVVENKMTECTTNIQKGNEKLEETNNKIQEIINNSINKQNQIEEKSNNLIQKIDRVEKKIDENNINVQKKIDEDMAALQQNTNQKIDNYYNPMKNQLDAINEKLLYFHGHIKNIEQIIDENKSMKIDLKDLMTKNESLEKNNILFVELSKSLLQNKTILENENEDLKKAVQLKQNQIDFLQQSDTTQQQDQNPHQDILINDVDEIINNSSESNKPNNSGNFFFRTFNTLSKKTKKENKKKKYKPINVNLSDNSEKKNQIEINNKNQIWSKSKD